MSSQTEAKWVDRTFDRIGFVSSKVLHTMRKSVSWLMDFLELPWDQVITAPSPLRLFVSVYAIYPTDTFR